MTTAGSSSPGCRARRGRRRRVDAAGRRARVRRAPRRRASSASSRRRPVFAARSTASPGSSRTSIDRSRAAEGPTSTSWASSTTSGSSAASSATRSTARPTLPRWFPRDELDAAGSSSSHGRRRPRVRPAGRSSAEREQHDRDRRRGAGRSSSSGWPGTSSAGRACSPTTSRRPGRPRRTPTAGSRSRSSLGGRSCRCSGSGCRSPGVADLVRAGRAPPPLRPPRRRDERDGRDLAIEDRAGRRRRVEIDHDFAPRVPGLGLADRPAVHPADRGPDAATSAPSRRRSRPTMTTSAVPAPTNPST